MSKPGLVASLLACLLLAAPALARLDETIVECHKRYGRPVAMRSVGTEVICRYRRGNYTVKVIFAKGRAVEVYYSRSSGNLLTQDDLDLFLDVNASTSRWVKVDQLAEWRKANAGHENDEVRQVELMRDMATFFLWSREDGEAEASYDRELGVLLICSAERLEREREEEKEEVKTDDPDNPLGF